MEIRSDGCLELLRDIRTRCRIFLQFQTWDDLLKLMANRSVDEALKNGLLLAMLESSRKDGDPRWTLVFLAVFWPGLESLCSRKRTWTDDPDELWQMTMIAFFRSLRSIDTRRRRTRLVQKIINGTAHYLHDECARSWRRTRNETLADRKALQELADSTHCESGRPRPGDDHAVTASRLHSHVRDGHISEDDYRLIVATRIYGHSLSDLASKSGENYQTLKKRRQRAEAVVRKHGLPD